MHVVGEWMVIKMPIEDKRIKGARVTTEQNMEHHVVDR
jgi:acetylglutamate kinase